jgi:hypothetical protein
MKLLASLARRMQHYAAGIWRFRVSQVMELPFPLILWTAIGLLVAILVAFAVSLAQRRDRHKGL